MSQPKVTLVIPVYNEEGIVRSAVEELVRNLQGTGWTHEIVLAENGSRDRTPALCAELSRQFPQVQTFSIGSPGQGNYGKALRQGILHAHGELVICDEIDLCDLDFHLRAVAILDTREADLVVGSKLAPGAHDERPFVRRLGSSVINLMLRVALGFRGTDTHGLKAFRTEVLRPIAEQCIVDKDLFTSELVIRAERANVRIREIPIQIREKRATSVHLFRRVPAVLRGLLRLVLAIRFNRA